MSVNNNCNLMKISIDFKWNIEMLSDVHTFLRSVNISTNDAYIIKIYFNIYTIRILNYYIYIYNLHVKHWI